jgi:hypothetical protein
MTKRDENIAKKKKERERMRTILQKKIVPYKSFGLL